MKDFEKEIELIDVVDVVLKWKWLIVVATCAGLVTGWFLSEENGVDKFAASVLLFMKPKPIASHKQDVDVEVSIPSYSEQFYESLALADDLKQALIDSLGLGGRVSSLDGMLQVEHVDKTGMRLKVESTQRVLAIQIVNAWAELFLRRNRGLSADEVEHFFDYVSVQYNRSRQLLEVAEDTLQVFEASNQISELQRRVSILDTTSRVMHDTLMLLQLKEAELQAELQSAKQEVIALEIDGVPLSLSNVAALRDTLTWPDIRHTRSVIALMLRLDDYQSELRRLDEEADIWLAEFDSKLVQQVESYRYVVKLADQKKRVQALQKIFHRLGDDGDIELKLKILREIRQETAADDAMQAKMRSSPASEHGPELPNNADVDLSEKLRLLKQRDRFMVQYLLEQEELTRLIESLNKAYDVHLGNRLTGQVKIAALRPQLQNIQILIARNRKLMHQVQNQLQIVEEKLSVLLSMRQRLTRSQETYEGTFLRFAAILEETRVAVAREKAAGDIQVLTRAIEARIVPYETPQQKAIIGGSVALVISTFVIFLLEYIRKARYVRSKLGT